MSLYQGDGTSLLPNVEVCGDTTACRTCVCLGVFVGVSFKSAAGIQRCRGDDSYACARCFTFPRRQIGSSYHGADELCDL